MAKKQVMSFLLQVCSFFLPQQNMGQLNGGICYSKCTLCELILIFSDYLFRVGSHI